LFKNSGKRGNKGSKKNGKGNKGIGIRLRQNTKREKGGRASYKPRSGRALVGFLGGGGHKGKLDMATTAPKLHKKKEGGVKIKFSKRKAEKRPTKKGQQTKLNGVFKGG